LAHKELSDITGPGLTTEELFQDEVHSLLDPDNPRRQRSVNPPILDQTLGQLRTTTGNDEVRSVLMQQLLDNLLGDKDALKTMQAMPTSPFQKDFQKLIPPASGPRLQQLFEDEPWLNQTSEQKRI